MNRVGSSDSSLPRVIGFDKELERFERWLSDPDAGTEVYSILGIGGIGKTTLLMEMATKTQRAAAIAVWLDGRSELSSSSSFLASMEASLVSGYGIYRTADMPLQPFIVQQLTLRKTVLLIDNGEPLERLEGWLLSRFLPELKSASVLIVVASRKGLPFRWRAYPYWGERVSFFPLRLFSREEVREYLRDCGLAREVQQDIAQRTEGLPLLLALTVDLLRSREAETRDRVQELPIVLSVELLREVASPHLHPSLTALAFLPAADQQQLNRLLDKPIHAADYHELSSLSFVRMTPHGLALHHVAARMLREEYASRSRESFQALRSKAFVQLAEHYHKSDRRMQSQIADHVLEIYREYLPSSHAYAHFSSSLKRGEQRPYHPDDLPCLHRYLAASVLQSDWQSELVHAEDYHSLLDEIARHCPEGIYIVRDERGIPLAFCAGVWLHASTLSLLERYAPDIAALLGVEADGLKRLPAEEADTIFVLLAAVDHSQQTYRPEELGAWLMQQWLVSMTSGLRGVLATADPQLNSLLPLLGFQNADRFTPNAGGGKLELTSWELDFRHTSFPAWMRRIILRTGAEAFEREAQLQQESGQSLDDRDAKHILQHLYHSDRLERYVRSRLWRMGAAEARAMAEELLMKEPARHPLTPLEQRMLREGYIIRKLNRNQLAESFHMSRTTFYRHSLTAMRHLALLMNE